MYEQEDLCQKRRDIKLAKQDDEERRKGDAPGNGRLGKKAD